MASISLRNSCRQQLPIVSVISGWGLFLAGTKRHHMCPPSVPSQETSRFLARNEGECGDAPFSATFGKHVSPVQEAASVPGGPPRGVAGRGITTFGANPCQIKRISLQPGANRHIGWLFVSQPPHKQGREESFALGTAGGVPPGCFGRSSKALASLAFRQ